MFRAVLSACVSYSSVIDRWQCLNAIQRQRQRHHRLYFALLLQSADKMRLLLKYVKEVQPALIEQFMDLGPPAVVAAMRNTITNTLGTLPPQFFTVTISTVGENMSQLMLSVLMTGYMFRNAQYRLELGNALGTRNSTAASAANAAATATATGAGLAATFVDSSNSSNSRLMQRSQSISVQGTVLDEDTYAPGVQKSRVQVSFTALTYREVVALWQIGRYCYTIQSIALLTSC